MAKQQSLPTNNSGNPLQTAEVERQLLKANPNIFNGVTNTKKLEILTALTVVEQRFEHSVTAHSGPLPLPEVLGKYDSIIPNGADRIMKMAEKQQEHRFKLETDTIGEQMSQSRRGQTFGLTIGIVAIVGSVTCILMGHDWPGAVLGAGGITGLVSVFVYGKRQQKKSLNNKAAE